VLLKCRHASPGMFLDGSGVSFSSHPHHLPTISAHPCPSFPREWVTEHHKFSSSWNSTFEITSNTRSCFHQSHSPCNRSRTQPTVTPRCLLRSRSPPRLLRRPKRIISHTFVTTSVKNGAQPHFCVTRTQCRRGLHPDGRLETK
jgi:hypothetical protein